MNAISLNNLWNYLQGLSLSASNQRWLGERLIEASAARTEEDNKLEKLHALFGSWSGTDGERMENAIRESRHADYERELVSIAIHRKSLPASSSVSRYRCCQCRETQHCQTGR